MLAKIFSSLIVSAFIIICRLDAFAVDAAKNDSLAEITVQSTLAEISDYRPGYLYMLVRNRSDSTLIIDSVTVAEYPKFLRLRPAYPGCSDSDMSFITRKHSKLPYPFITPVQKNETRIYGVYVEAPDQVLPGEHELLFNVHYHGYRAEKTVSGSIPVSQKIKASAYGENQILGALQNGITFLMIPGVIVLIVTGIIFSLFFPEIYKEKYPEWLKGEKALNLQFMVSAITVSLIFAGFIYPLLAPLTGNGKRNYLYGYGFIDIYQMWLFAVVTGIAIPLFWKLGTALLNYLKHQKSEQDYRKAFRDSDSPMAFLKKILDSDPESKAWFPVLTIQSTMLKGFLIEKDTEKKQELWLIPPINVVWQTDADDLNNEFSRYRNDKNASLDDILKVLERGTVEPSERKGVKSLEWKTVNGYIEKPSKIQKGAFGTPKAPESLFYSKFSEDE